jgi:hypothetical protein
MADLPSVEMAGASLALAPAGSVTTGDSRTLTFVPAGMVDSYYEPGGARQTTGLKA